MTPIDTSKLGPIRVPAPPETDRARELFATQIESNGPAHKNTADAIRAGFSNIWILAGIGAIARVLRQIPEEGDE